MFSPERGREGSRLAECMIMGERLANNVELVFQDCFIPDENVVGEVHKGFQTLSEFFPQPTPTLVPAYWCSRSLLFKG